MAMDFSLTVFWSICKVMYSFGETIKKNTFFTSKSDLNVIFGQVLMQMWRRWSTRLINTQKVDISKKSEFLCIFE